MDNNPFVTYLNTLHCRDAGNENALAESQGCNPFFAYIQFPHPLVDDIRDILIAPEVQHIILTGHAGDGKSTIALELYKNLHELSFEQPLTEQMSKREDITLTNGNEISIIKDLSEWSDEDRLELLAEILKGETRFFLVSNTGTLLNLFSDYSSQRLKLPGVETEGILLEAISFKGDRILNYENTKFSVFNLALWDNLSIACNIFKRMLTPERWLECNNKDCKQYCYIYHNVSLIQERQDMILERLFIAYRRMYEYGTRLTIRQLTAHLAYMLTSGQECANVHQLKARTDKTLLSDYMFYNRFFGDNGKEVDTRALQLRAVKETRKQHFGERPCPTWERKLWLLTHDKSFSIDIPSVNNEFDRLLQGGSSASYIDDKELTADRARNQVRRMLYFLYEFPNSDELFITQFLSSPAIMKWWAWQGASAHISLDEISTFKQRVFHVLQEQFTGVRLPETLSGPQTLYITLSRHKQDIRQSAQVALAQIDFTSEFSLVLENAENNWGDETRKDLRLIGLNRLKDIKMPLGLPFLDYIIMRRYGEAGEELQAAYATRLAQLKTDLLKYGSEAQTEHILLIRLRTDHTFSRQKYAVHDNELEVANA